MKRLVPLAILLLTFGLLASRASDTACATTLSSATAPLLAADGDGWLDEDELGGATDLGRTVGARPAAPSRAALPPTNIPGPFRLLQLESGSPRAPPSTPA